MKLNVLESDKDNYQSLAALGKKHHEREKVAAASIPPDGMLVSSYYAEITNSLGWTLVLTLHKT
jgi:hypothetical protein